MTALMLTREAMVNVWKDPTSGPIALADGSDLGHLDALPRAAVLDYELQSGLHVEIGRVNADLNTQSNPINLQPEDDTLETVGAARLWFNGVPMVTLVAPGQDVFIQQVSYLEHYADLRADRLQEIDVQIGDIVTFFSSMLFLHPARNRRLLEFLQAALRLCVMIEFRVKHAFGCPRPAAYSPLIQPIIQTPSHGTLPSGHATEAFFLARLFKEFATHLPIDQAVFNEQCDKLATRIAANRTVAGVHFPADSAAGSMLGTALAEYVLHMVKRQQFDGNGKPIPLSLTHAQGDFRKFRDSDFTTAVLKEMNDDTSAFTANLGTALLDFERSPQLNWLWESAVDELTAGQGLGAVS